ncbi:34949_t:CDS:1, partial [Racocetra persica]
ITAKCTHENNVCRECVERHIDTSLSGKGDVVIHCLSGNCRQVIEHSDVKRIASRE